MPKEYRTISEVAGPLMLIKNVDGVAYNELGEIELKNGERRRCKVLEVNRNDVLVQLFESSTGINLTDSKVRFLGKQMELAVSEDMLGRAQIPTTGAWRGRCLTRSGTRTSPARRAHCDLSTLTRQSIVPTLSSACSMARVISVAR